MAIGGNMSTDVTSLGIMYSKEPGDEYTHDTIINSLSLSLPVSLSLSLIYNNCVYIYIYTLVHCNDLYAQLLFIFIVNRRGLY